MDFTRNVSGISSFLKIQENPGFSAEWHRLRHTQRHGGVCRVRSVSAETSLEAKRGRQWEYLYYLLTKYKLHTIETGKIRSVYPLHSHLRKGRPFLGSEGQVGSSMEEPN